MCDDCASSELCFVCGKHIDKSVRRVTPLGNGLFICSLCEGEKSSEV